MRLLTAACLVALLAAALWLWTSRGNVDLAQPRVPEAPKEAAAHPPAAAVEPPAPRVSVPVDAPPPPEPAEVRETETPIVEADPEPEDPTESGACALEVHVVARDTGVALERGKIELWRLAAPGNRDWTSGDQLQAVSKISAGPARFTDLPEGAYRVSCSERRASDDDPPPIEVRCPATSVTVEVALPRSFLVLLDIRDETGLPLDQRVLASPTESFTYAPHPWVQRRSRVGAKGGAGIVPVELEMPYLFTEHTAGPRGFELGPYEEARARTGRSRYVDVSPDGRSEVRVTIPKSAVADLRAFAVAVPTKSVLRSVRLPDGRALEKSECELELTCEAVLVDGPPPDWRNVPIRAKVRCAGYEPLDFELRLRDWPPRERVLVPSKDG